MNITIIGHFGGKEIFLDGQTIKTKAIYEELSRGTDWKINKVDTYYRKHNILKLLFDFVVSVMTTRHMIVLLAGNGMRFFFPILYFCSKLLRKKVYHCVIGASLDRRVQKYKNFKKYINSFSVNWVETKGLAKRLESLGVNNVELLYNFKRLDILTEDEVTSFYREPLKLCTFSRVMKEKGIEDAIKAVISVNENLGRIVYSLDIYGQIDSEQTKWFENVMRTLPDYILYKGVVPYDKSVGVLKEYFALLFPTRYYTEGVPGTIIDAYAAGLPVIASKWENFDNIINEETGISYEFENIDDLIYVLTEVAMSPELVTAKRFACLKKAEDFMPDALVSKIVEKISGKKKLL